MRRLPTGDLGPMKRPRPAKRHKREPARVDAFLDRARTDGIRHVCVDDRDDAFGRLCRCQPELVRKFGNHSVAGPGVQHHRPAKKAARIKPAQNDVRIRDGRFVPALAIGGRPGDRARALRSRPEGTALVDMRDRSATRADGVDVDHRQDDGEPGDRGGARIGLGQVPILHDADIRAGAADIERDQPLAADKIADHRAAQHPGGKARHQRERGLRAHHGRRRDATVRGHDAQFGAYPGTLKRGGEVVDVASHLRPDECGKRCGGEAFEFAELRRYMRGCRHECAGHLFLNDVLRPLFMRRIEVGKQEAHRDRLDPFGTQFTGRRPDLILIERHKHLARWRDEAPPDRLAVASRDQRAVLPGQFLHDRIVMDALVPPDVDDIAEPLIGNHPGPGTLVFENRIGRRRRAMEHMAGRGRVDPVHPADSAQPSHDTDRGIFGRGGHLVGSDAAPAHVAQDEVGKGPAHIDADDLHSTSAFATTPRPANRFSDRPRSSGLKPLPMKTMQLSFFLAVTWSGSISGD